MEFFYQAIVGEFNSLPLPVDFSLDIPSALRYPVRMDHLDYIRITDLEDSDTEVFQGLVGGSTTTTPDDGDSTDWGTIPDEVMTAVKSYTDDLITWLGKAAAYDPDSSDRGLPAVIGSAPVIPAIIGAIMTGGASLPVMAAGLFGQIVLNVAGTALQNYAASLDTNSPQYLLKKALLYKDSGSTEYQSILKSALLYLVSDDGKDIDQTKLRSVLNDKLADLGMVDAEIKFGDNQSLHVHGKVLIH